MSTEAPNLILTEDDDDPRQEVEDAKTEEADESMVFPNPVDPKTLFAEDPVGEYPVNIIYHIATRDQLGTVIGNRPQKMIIEEWEFKGGNRPDDWSKYRVRYPLITRAAGMERTVPVPLEYDSIDKLLLEIQDIVEKDAQTGMRTMREMSEKVNEERKKKARLAEIASGAFASPQELKLLGLQMGGYRAKGKKKGG